MKDITYIIERQSPTKTGHIVAARATEPHIMKLLEVLIAL
jgi:hypothetical protein